jgi:membrane protein required for colicin V production
LDLAVVVLTLFFGLWGAFSGAARQVAQWVASLAAFFGAGPLGHFFGQAFAHGLSTSLSTGVVLATVASFLIVFLVVRGLLTLVLRRVLAGGDPDNRGLDRALGFLLGGGKLFALAYLSLCAVAFLENNVTVAGRKLVFLPKDSRLYAFAREHNLLEAQLFSGARELAQVATRAHDPKALLKLKGNEDFAALSKDPRFKALLGSDAARKALETGDVRGLLQLNQAAELLQDAQAMRRLERVADGLE